MGPGGFRNPREASLDRSGGIPEPSGGVTRQVRKDSGTLGRHRSTGPVGFRNPRGIHGNASDGSPKPSAGPADRPHASRNPPRDNGITATCHSPVTKTSFHSDASWLPASSTGVVP